MPNTTGAAVAISDRRFYAYALATGTIAGLVGVAFHFTVEYISRWPRLLRHFLGETALSIGIAAAIGVLFATIALFLVRRFAPEAAGSGVPDVEGAMEGGVAIPWRRILPVKFFGGILALSSGMMLGREGPTIHLGASVAVGLAERFRLNSIDGRALLAAGGAAGLAAAFNAPLAAILFVVEETRRQFPYSLRSYVGVMLASILSGIVTTVLGGTRPYLEMASFEMAEWLLPVFALLGLVLGGVGVFFNRMLIAALDLTARISTRAPYAPALVVGSVLGAATVVFPLANGGGEGMIMRVLEDHPGYLALIVLLFLRFFGVLASYSTGVPGGIFAPILAIATVVGLFFAHGVTDLLPEVVITHSEPAFAVAAMAGLFASTIRAPLVGVVLALELSGAYPVLLPALVTATVSYLTAAAIGGKPIYEQLLERTRALKAARAAAEKAEKAAAAAAAPPRPAVAGAAAGVSPEP
ncbi:H(+)/Cl(-) exchange transporter ClcA [Segnochrobactraceae bacterium EtOH-i3]